MGTTVGKAILESGGDAVFVDMASSPNEQTWSTSNHLYPLDRH